MSMMLSKNKNENQNSKDDDSRSTSPFSQLKKQLVLEKILIRLDIYFL